MRKKISLDYKTLADRVRARLISLRTERKMSLNQAASLAGFSRNGLEKVEVGDVQPTLETLLRLAEFYEESLPQFFATVYEEAGLAQKIKAEVNEKAVKDDQYKKAFAELSQKLGFLEHLDSLAQLKHLQRKNPQAYEAVVTLLATLAPKTTFEL